MAPSRIEVSETTTVFSNKVDAQTKYGDFRDEFYANGYAVIKGVLSKESAKGYQSKALDWLESFPLGFDRNDKSTWKKENVPQSFKGGMYLHFRAAHEKYVWDIRT